MHTLLFFLASMAPTKKKEIASGAFRAMIAGTVACFMTACIAGTVHEFGTFGESDHRAAAHQCDNYRGEVPATWNFMILKVNVVLKAAEKWSIWNVCFFSLNFFC